MKRKLTDAEARSIKLRSSRHLVSNAKLARAHGVSRRTIADVVAGRGAYASIGKSHATAFSDQDVFELRRLARYEGASLEFLARRHPAVSAATIRAAVRGLTYRHVEMP